MNKSVTLQINGRQVTVPEGTIVAAAVALAGSRTENEGSTRTWFTCFRRSVRGESRGPLCGMGVCMECRVTINNQTHCRSCRTLCAEGMEVQTDE